MKRAIGRNEIHKWFFGITFKAYWHSSFHLVLLFDIPYIDYNNQYVYRENAQKSMDALASVGRTLNIQVFQFRYCGPSFQGEAAKRFGLV